MENCITKLELERFRASVQSMDDGIGKTEVLKLFNEIDRLNEKANNNQTCYTAEMCEHERLKIKYEWLRKEMARLATLVFTLMDSLTEAFDNFLVGSPEDETEENDVDCPTIPIPNNYIGEEPVYQQKGATFDEPVVAHESPYEFEREFGNYSRALDRVREVANSMAEPISEDCTDDRK